MSVYSKRNLSGSTSGRGVKLAATATPGTLIHTAHATDKDVVWLWAVNSDTVDRKVTIEFGGVTSPDDLIERTIPAESGLILLVPGIPLTGGLLVRGFAAAANVVNVFGHVTRITE